MEIQQAKNEVLEASRELVERGLVARTWGNVSYRIDEQRFAITPSGIGYERLNSDNIVVVDIDSLKHEGDIKPSSEKGIHAAAYRLDANANCIIHTHQTYATCISVAGFSSLSPTDEELAALGGKISVANYGLPGTKALRKHVEQALTQGSSAILMESHGALLTGENRDIAFRRAMILEEVCGRATIDIPLGGAPCVISRRAETGALSIDYTETVSETPVEEQTRPIIEKLHTELYRKYPQFNCVMHLKSPVIDAVMRNVTKLPAVLDDFAQIVGGNVEVCAAISGANAPEIGVAVKSIRGRNCVFVGGLGAICCAAYESDCRAVLTLVEKNALAYLNAAKYGKSPALSFVDRTLMRLIYQMKYSKKK
jgi:L-fuculose-phosphate aldolase